MRPRAELVLVGVTLLWASTFVITKDVIRELAPLPFLSVRFGLAALVLISWKRNHLRDRRLIRDGVVLGLLNSSGLLLQVFGQAYTTVSKSSFITSLNTPLTPMLGLLLYRTRPTGPQRAAVVVATAGLMLLTWPGAGAHWNAGDVVTIGCAAMYALTIVEIARRAPRHRDLLALTAVQVLTAALVFVGCLIAVRVLFALVPLDRVPEMLRLEARPFLVGSRAAAELIYMALVCTVVTFAGQTWAMSKMSATHAAIIFALEPVFATGMAIGLTGAAEWPGARGAVGAGLVMLAVAVSELRLP